MKIAKILKRTVSAPEKRTHFGMEIQTYQEALVEDDNPQTRGALRELPDFGLHDPQGFFIARALVGTLAI